MLVDYPENATSLGIDTGPRAALKARLSDRSVAAQDAIAQRVAARLTRFAAVDEATLDPASRIDVDVMRTAHEFAAEGFAFPYGDVALLNPNWSWRNAPYVVAQNTGAFLELPASWRNSTPSRHQRMRMPTWPASRLTPANSMVRPSGLHSAAAQGVIAPDFVLDQTLSQIKMARGGNVSDWTVVKSLATRTSKMPGNFAARAEKIGADKIAPALDRQIAELEAHRQRATSDAGVWKLPRGDEYYAWTLRAATTTRMTPDEIHARGQEELRALQAEMDVILRQQGLTAGTVGERMTALGKDKRFQFPDGDEGRARIMAYIDEQIADMRKRLPNAFSTLVPGNFEVKRLPPEVEPGAPGAYGGAGTIDGKVPGKFWINLYTTSRWTNLRPEDAHVSRVHPGPRVAGRVHVQAAAVPFASRVQRVLGRMGAVRRAARADELGVYEDDPVGRLGYLQSIAFRACRLVVDTGLHAKRWTREQAVRWFATTNGSGEEEVRSEVDRYCAWPGQACGYKVGHSEINRLRAQAKQAMGAKFDFRKFNDTVVTGGGVPMVVLARTIEALGS